ncbi:chromosome-associated kinesin KIF4 isoform X2 [Bradysia coprophila]|uniref:chromosome-associated kinesin KIF4 isoform X2 n=1 Tax=Bradysia coprophila TaxID=38358 RepID=UPI00187D938D|nr:chromosome-associated kinesin KIF4 isoform X2 [Bradysia coprophila]
MESVQVAVRVRPLVASELTRGCKDIVAKTPNEPQVVVQSSTKTSDTYTFNYVFGQHETQEMIYSNSVRPLVLKLLKGYNVTILAYGQTGSGKTHTMGTTFDGNSDPEHLGVIPRAVSDIFENIECMPEHDFDVHCSFMELYQEQLYDLLSTKEREQNIVDIREDNNKEIVIPNLTEVPVKTIEETTNCLIRGSAGRAVGSTAMNATSSRSHAVFTITIEMLNKNDPNSSTKSKFHLVDLAGSERSKKTKATGDRFKEGVKINQGLFALGNVISALGGAEKIAHIRYRDSKLTRLLQDSLGGNSMTLMIACVSPADYNIEETINTLRYADRAKQIKNKPIVNQDPKAAEINRMNEIIQKLRLELLAKGTGQNTGNSAELYRLRDELAKEQQNSKVLTARLEEMLHEVVNMQYRLNESEEMAEKLISKSKLIKEKCFELNDNITKDDCPVELIIQSSQIKELKNLIVEMDALTNSNSKTIVEASTPASTYERNLLNSSNTDTEMSRYTSKQIGVQGELKQMKSELQLKEELLHRYLDNLSSFETLKTDEENKNYEEIIAKLEEEKEDLKNTLKVKTNNVSAKLAEERRKRVQVLEHEISEMKKKNLQQAQILKHREQQIGKIDLLQKEIHEIKSQKVQLIRNMKTESERFRQWKLQREKELTQLKAKDRKLETEMARKDLLHDKQKNILKRRVDESLMTIKRLKDTLEKGKNAKRPNKINGKVDHIKGWMDEELEVILSVIDAKQSLEQLIEDRSVMNLQLNQYKKQFEITDADRSEMAQLQEDIEMRNAQISDLRDKIATSNVEKNVQTICEGLHSMPETKAAIKYLFNRICDSRTEYISNLTKLQDLRSSNELAEMKRTNMDELQKQEIQNLIEQKHETEKDYEEKISILLRQLNSTGDRNSEEVEQIHEDTLENLRMKNEMLESQIKELMTELSKRTRSARNKVVSHVMDESVLMDSIITELDDEEHDTAKDPDWRQTPAYKLNRQSRLQDSKRPNSLTVSINSTEADGQTFCKCKTDCKTLRCKCRKTAMACSENCGCPADCVNTTSGSNNSSLKRESPSQSINDNDEEPHTPKKTKLDDYMDDITITPYPYNATNKRKPLLI